MATLAFPFVSRSRRGALIDDDYRYALWRTWSAGPAVLFVGLNPSVADAQSDDPTIRRCVRFAMSWGFGTLYMGNLFAYRTTWPEYLKKAAAGGAQRQARRATGCAAEQCTNAGRCCTARAGDSGRRCGQDSRLPARLLRPLEMAAVRAGPNARLDNMHKRSPPIDIRPEDADFVRRLPVRWVTESAPKEWNGWILETITTVVSARRTVDTRSNKPYRFGTVQQRVCEHCGKIDRRIEWLDE